MKRVYIPLVVLSLFLIVVCLPPAVFAAPKEAAQAAPPEILAQIGKKSITKADFEARIAALPPEYKDRLKSDVQKKEFLEAYIQAQLLAMEARTQKLDKKKAVLMRLEDMNTSVLAQEYAKEILSKVAKSTDDDIKKYYETHKPQFVDPPMVKAQHILIKSDTTGAKPEEMKTALATAESIKKELDGGADFGKLAEKYSDDPGSKTKGGDLGFFTKDRMVPEFAQAAFSLKKGAISSPVKTTFGYHLIKVNDAKEGKQMDLKEATPRIRSQLENQWRQEGISKEIERLKKKYDVTVNK